MSILIYLIIVVLFGVLLFWTWNNTKDFGENTKRIKFITIGFIILSIITLILFNISKIGVNYESKDIMKEIRKISLLLFIPINGFLSLPHIANIKSTINLGSNDEKTKRKIITLGIILIISIVIEIIYLKDFQSGIIQIIKSK